MESKCLIKTNYSSVMQNNHSSTGLVIFCFVLFCFPPFNPNTFVGLVGKVRKNYLPKEEGREGGEKKSDLKAHAARPPGPGLERGTWPRARRGSGAAHRGGGGCLDKQAFLCL